MSTSVIRSFFLVITPLLLIISFFFNLKFLQEKNDQNRVTQVVDGDTFQLQSGRRVRLLGVDAPEYDRCGGVEAKNLLSGLIQNKIVSLKEEQTEAYGRTLALVYLENDLINEKVLAAGWGKPDYRPSKERGKLTNAYNQAKSQNLGINSLCKIPAGKSNIQNPKCNIKGNIDPATYQKTYHLSACRQYNQVVLDLSAGDQWFCSESEAKSAGFTKSQACP